MPQGTQIDGTGGRAPTPASRVDDLSPDDHAAIASGMEDALVAPGDEDEAGVVAAQRGGRPSGVNAGSNGEDGADGADGDGHEDSDDDDDDAAEVQDYSKFAAMAGVKTSSSTLVPSRNKRISSQSIRKGEKDFEEHGTRAQRDALEQSRAVMESVLAHTRVHGVGGAGGGGDAASVVRGWYFPDVWQAEEEEEEVEEKPAGGGIDGRSDGGADGGTQEERTPGRRFGHMRHRVVMVEVARGTVFLNVGVVPGRPKWIEGVPKASQPAPRPGYDRVWLLPEEALFLVERGSMELWWPLKPIEAVLEACTSRKDGARRGGPTTGGRTTAPPMARGLAKTPAGDKEDAGDAGDEGDEGDGDKDKDKNDDDDDDEDEDEDGILLSLQAAYALLIGSADESGRSVCEERGRVPLPVYQVYTHLRRSGYNVLRAVKTDAQTWTHPLDQPPPPAAPLSSLSPVTNVWQWLFSLAGGAPASSAGAPLVRPGLYRSYGPIYAQLRLLPYHRHGASDRSPPPSGAVRIVFHVWKAGAQGAAPFSKTRPPPPDFYMAVADAQTTGVPTLDEITELLASVPPLVPPPPAPRRPKGNNASSGASMPSTTSTTSTASISTAAARPATSAWTVPPFPVLYRRLKLGRRCVIIAVVDCGLVNYMRFADGTFGSTPLHPRFDGLASGRFSKGGGGGGGGGSRKSGGKGKGGGKGHDRKTGKGGGGSEAKANT